MRQIRETVSKIISFIEIKSEVPEPTPQKSENQEKKCLEETEEKKYLETQDARDWKKI